LELKNDIQSKVQHDMSQQQREYFLQQQIKTIQEELGGVSYEEEIEAMKTKAETKLWHESPGGRIFHTTQLFRLIFGSTLESFQR
jgi:ATP-dependent Lon protease